MSIVNVDGCKSLDPPSELEIGDALLERFGGRLLMRAVAMAFDGHLATQPTDAYSPIS